MYTWYKKRRTGQLLSVWFLLSMATLSKGPVGILLPCMIFGVFLLIQKENFLKATLKCIMLGLPAIIIPFIWYYAAYQIRGDAFLDRVLFENVGRFSHMAASEMGAGYELGHENPFWMYGVYLLSGFLPWTLLLVISLFFIKYSKPKSSLKETITNAFNKLMSMDKVLLFSLTVVVISLIFYSIPLSKRSVYILPVYPFLAIFIARFFIYLADAKPMAVRISTSMLVGISILALAIVGLAYTGLIDVEELSYHISKRERTLRDFKLFSDMFIQPGIWGLLAITVLLWAIINSIYLLRKKMNVKILMAGFGVMLAINIFMDAYLLQGFKDGYSVRPFAKRLSEKYELTGNVYVTNDLLKYRNFYGLNFYLHNNFKNIALEMPDTGFFIALKDEYGRIQEEYKDYEFTLLESSDKYNEYKGEIGFYRIKKKD